jgi:GTPase SAR1 family protein
MPPNVTLNTRKIVILGSVDVGESAGFFPHPLRVSSRLLARARAGKSSLLKQFVEGNFPDGYYPTIESTATKTITYNGTEYPCEIIDTAGQVRLVSCSLFEPSAHSRRAPSPALPPPQDESSLLKSRPGIGIHGYVLVYSIASRASFNMIQVIYDKILNYSGLEEIAAIVVGSKADLNMRWVLLLLLLLSPFLPKIQIKSKY